MPLIGARSRRRPRSVDPEEGAIASALARRDPDAIRLVQERYGRVLGGYLRQALGDPGASEDVLQQVLVEVWRRGPDYDPKRASLMTWMMTITRSRAIDHLRRRVPEPVDNVEMLDRPEAPVEDHLDELVERWRLAELLGRIPHQEALLLRMRFYEDLSQAEIAERIGVPLGTVKSRMVSGLARLRELIVREDGEEAGR